MTSIIASSEVTGDDGGSMRTLVGFAVLLVAPIAIAAPASPSTAAPWEAAPLAGSPSAIARAAAALPKPAGADRQVLFDERVYRLRADGASERRTHLVFRVLTDAGVSNGPGLEVAWQPWCEARPEVRVRVVSPDGTSHALEAATIEDAGVSLGESLYGDSRVLRAPLPALSVGAVVEEEIVERHTATPFVAPTVVYSEALAPLYPAERTRLVVDAPTALPLRWAVHGPLALKPERHDGDGRTTLTFTVGPRPPFEAVAGAPIEQVLPLIMFSTGGSWQDVTRGYERIAEAELARTPSSQLVETARAALGTTSVADRAAVAAALLAFVHREVRPVGIEFGRSSIVPHVPADTLQRRYGDCKDQALLLVGLLRAVGVPARLALLRVVGLDVDERLPGLERFDHVIVYVPGEKPLWIDSTDEWSRVNELPAGDQGRLALIVDGGAGRLVRTPVSPASANRMLSTREIFLAEAGRARVIEKVELTGGIERWWRSVMSRVDAQKMRQVIESLASNELGVKTLTRYQATEPRRLDQPMQLELEVADSPIASTGPNGADLVIPIARLTGELPDWMRKPDGKSRGGLDLLVEQASVIEWRYRVAPPPGLALESLPANGDIPLGPLRLTKRFAREPDGRVAATLRLEIDRRRFTALEVDRIRAGAATLAAAEPVELKFVDVGRAALDAGRLREALDEYRRLVALHPNESLHHEDLAAALVGVGLGEAARAEAMRAAALEPNKAGPQRALAWVLTHDPMGRRFAPGFDYAGAEAALRRALAIDGKDELAHRDLAVLLEYDAEGHRYGGRTAQALAEYRAIDKERLERLEVGSNALWDLERLHRWADLEKETRGQILDAVHARLRLVAVAAHKSVAAALAEAAGLRLDLREQAIREAAESLLWERLYPQAAGLFERAAHDPEAPAWVAPRGDLARRLRRLEETRLDDRDPGSLVRRFYAELLRPDDEAHLWARLRAFVAGGAPAFDDADERTMLMSRRSWRRHELPYEVLRDAMVSAGTIEKDGDDQSGWRIRFTKPMNAGVDTWFVVREGGRYKMSAPRKGQVHLGRRILDALDAHDFATATRWLDWTSELYRNGDPIDRAAPAPFARVWPAGGGTPEQARVAALMLLVDRSAPDNQRAVDGLRAALAAPPAGVPPDAVALVLARALLSLERPDDALAVAAAAPEPASRLWFDVRATALLRLKRWSEVRRVAEAELLRVPDDAAALRTLRRADQRDGRWDAFERDSARLAATGRAVAADYNECAWAALFYKGVDEHALDDARRAVELSQRRTRFILHTLAAIEAGLGRDREAYATLVESIEAGDGQPIPSDHYVLGRIAENLGLRDVALSEYRKVVRSNPKDPSPFDAAVLAEARVRALAK